MRLLADGDGLGDDRRLNMLLKVLRCRQVFTEYVPEGIQLRFKVFTGYAEFVTRIYLPFRLW